MKKFSTIVTLIVGLGLSLVLGARIAHAARMTLPFHGTVIQNPFNPVPYPQEWGITPGMSIDGEVWWDPDTTFWAWYMNPQIVCYADSRLQPPCPDGNTIGTWLWSANDGSTNFGWRISTGAYSAGGSYVTQIYVVDLATENPSVDYAHMDLDSGNTPGCDVNQYACHVTLVAAWDANVLANATVPSPDVFAQAIPGWPKDGPQARGSWGAVTFGAQGPAGNPYVEVFFEIPAGGFGTPVNRPPVASIDGVGRVRPGLPVTLNGSASFDPDGDAITHYWWEVDWSDSNGLTQIALNDNPMPSWTPRLNTTYTVILVVEDMHGSRSDPVSIQVSTLNGTPVVDAGPDVAISTIVEPITLASHSYDPDGDGMTHQWFVKSPVDQHWYPVASGPVVTFPSVSFFIPWGITIDSLLSGGKIEIKYIATDTFGASAEDFLSVSLSNLPPVAVAGLNQTAPLGSAVILDGIGSFDPNGTPVVSYQWSLASKPAGSAVTLAGTPSPNPTAYFIPDVPGLYVASLIVSDGLLDSLPNTLTVSGTSSTQEVTATLSNVLQTLNTLSDASFSSPNQRKALTNKINAILQDIENGLYQDAKDKLQNDVRAKMDGCAVVRKPDKNDWLVTCGAQSLVYYDLNRAILLLNNL